MRASACAALCAFASACTIADELNVPTCIAAAPLRAPGADDGPSLAPATFVVRTVRFEGAPLPGLALDETCACATKCTPRDRALACPAAPIPVDNATSAVFADLRTLAGGFVPVDAERSINADLAAGVASVLVTVSNYSGRPDDPSVLVRMASSMGTGGTKPSYDGRDTFANSDDGVEAAGYVSRGVLVARFANVRARFQVQSDYRLRDAALVGQLTTPAASTSPTSTFVLTEATLAGAWPLDDVLANFDRVRLPTGKVLCNVDIARGPTKEKVCAHADAVISPGPIANLCDALSFGLALTLAPAAIGASVAIPIDTACGGVTPQRCVP